LASRLLETFKQKITSLALEPGSGGCFEVTFDGDAVYSKLETGSFPDEATLVAAATERMG
jgi:selenoprotein W-related protein